MQKTNQIIGNVSSIETLGLSDGPGVRFVVFMQGCPLRCIYCHNPETWDAKTKKEEYTPKKLLAEILKYKNYFGKTGGVTFSGGEPLIQREFLLECLKELKKEKIHTCIDTCGQTINNKDILNYTDLVLLDLKGINNEDFQLITGAETSNFSEFVKDCEETNTSIWLRYVLVPTINDSKKHLEKLAKLSKTIKTLIKIELLPYHKLGEAKYQELGINNPMFGLDALTEKKLKESKSYLRKQLKEIDQKVSVQ